MCSVVPLVKPENHQVGMERIGARKSRLGTSTTYPGVEGHFREGGVLLDLGEHCAMGSLHTELLE